MTVLLKNRETGEIRRFCNVEYFACKVDPVTGEETNLLLEFCGGKKEFLPARSWQELELEQLDGDSSERESESDSAVVKPQRQMPDRILGDWSNLRRVVRQFRNLGYGDTYILETILDVADVKNGKDLFIEVNGEMVPSKLE